MQKSLPLWAELPIGMLCGAAIGTIVASAGLQQTYPEAFKVAFGAVASGAIGLGVLAFAWTFKQQRDDYGAAHWQTKAELKKNDMLQRYCQVVCSSC